MNRSRPALLAIALLLASAARAGACTVADIALERPTWTRDAGWFVISGELVNHCAEPTGVQIELSLRDAGGQTVSVEHVWPAKSQNVAAGERYAFTVQTRGYATATDVSVRVSDVRRWPSR